MSNKSKINLKDKISDGEIDLSVSEIKDVPVKEIAAFKKAFSLDLSNNLIVTLPKQFAPLLVHITKLDLSKNQLSELPDNFGELLKLKHLDLYRNQLQHLPLSFGKLTALRWLDLKDNPLLPAIRETGGSCGDAKECQQCARDIVTFYTKMAASVEEEKMARERQKEEDRKQKELALKMQRHKEKKKQNKQNKLEQKQQQELLSRNQQKAKETAKNGSLVNNGVANSRKSSKKTLENRKENQQKNKSQLLQSNKPKSMCGVVLSAVWTLLFVSVALFVVTSVGAPCTRPMESKILEWWQSVVVAHVPSEYRWVEREWAVAFAHAHNVTGDGLLRVYQQMALLLQGCWQPLSEYVLDTCRTVYGHVVSPRD